MKYVKRDCDVLKKNSEELKCFIVKQIHFLYELIQVEPGPVGVGSSKIHFLKFSIVPF